MVVYYSKHTYRRSVLKGEQLMNIFKNRNFTLMIIGQIISLFGNSILRFSISLYILDQTGSATIFATILAISFIPTILLSPIGGFIADRLSRKYIMLVLDFLTSFLLILFSIYVAQGNVSMIAIGFVMILLSIIQACYQPSVQSSVPLLVEETQLIQANGVVVQVNALSSLLGPILGSMLFAFLPFTWLLWISAGSFFISAIIECIMKIPYVKKTMCGSIINTAIHDLRDGMVFIVKEKPVLFRLLLVLALLNLVLSSLLTVGLPVISNITLALPPQFYGWLEAGMAIGSIVGSILLATFFKQKQIQASYQFLIAASFALSFIGIALCFQNARYLSYGLIVIASISAMACATMFNILAQTYLQQSTPSHLLGKVSSFVTMIVMCSYPIGQSIYGFVFDVLSSHQYFILFTACALSLIISLKLRSSLKQI